MGAIAIGLGGVGKVVLMKLRRMIIEEHGSLKEEIRFLHIDTFESPAPEGGQDFATEVLGRDITLKPTERIVLSEGLPQPPFTVELANHPHVREWFPAGLPINIDFAQGAGGTRPYGRLAFHHKVHEFRNKLNQMLAALGGTADLYLVCSLFGGTGSGTFMDVCYVARDEKNRLGARGELLGFFIIGATNPNAVMQGNCYVSLMELEYYMTKQILTTIDREGQEVLGFRVTDDLRPFEARYPVTGASAVVSSASPVDTCYLFGAGNGARTFQRSELEELVARRIFLEMMPGVGTPLRAKRIDIKGGTVAYYTPDSLQRRARTFFATGCSVIEFPAPRLMNALGAGFAACCARHLLYERAVGFGDLRREIQSFLEHRLGVRLTENQLRRELERQETRTVSSTMRADREGWLDELRGKIRDSSFDGEAIHAEAEMVVHRADDATGADGAYVLTVENNLERLWGKIAPEIERLIAHHVTDPTRGPGHTRDFIESLEKELSNDRKKYHDRREGADRAMRKARDEVDRRVRRIREDRDYRRELEIHAGWLCTRELAVFMEQGVRRAIYGAMETLASRMIDTLERTKQQIAQYMEALRELEGFYGAEVKKACESLMSWVKADALAGERLFGDLEGHLARLEDPTDMVSFSRVARELLARYNIPDPFEGAIDARAGETVQGLGEVFPLLLADRNRFREELFGRCRERFASLGRVNLCDLLVQKLDARERDRLFGDKRSLAQWPLEVFTNDPTIDHDPNLCEKRWVGVPNAVDLNNHPVWSGVLQGYDAQSERFNAVTEPYRMVFANEMGVFCLRNLAAVEAYAGAYQGLSSEDRKKRHTNSQICYPDLMPPDPRIQEIHLRAERAALLGRVMELLRQAEDPETHYPAIYLYHSDPQTGVRLSEKLCPEWTEAVAALREGQVRKEVERHAVSPTPLEVLEREIHGMAEGQKTREEKEALSRQLGQYLGNRLLQIGGDGNERHPVYQKEMRTLNEFVKRFDLGALE